MDSLSLNRNGATSLRSRASVVGSLQVSPPSWLTAVSSPLAPPFDHRSCCHAATMLFGSVGFTSTHGSTSLLRKFTPGCPEISQPAKGLETDTTLSGLRVNGPALLGAIVASVNAPARASSRMTVRERISASVARASIGNRCCAISPGTVRSVHSDPEYCAITAEMSRPNGVNSTFRRLARLAYRGVTRLGASAEPMTAEDLLDAEGQQPDPAVGQVVDQALSADGGPCVCPRTHV